jgi:hypothetical protein
MPIYDSSRDYGTGQVLILWDGDKPSDEAFLEHARELYGVVGRLEVEEPTEVRGMQNPGTATVTPNAKVTGAAPHGQQPKLQEVKK